MRKQNVRGGTRMKELGHKQINVWFDPTENAILQEAAEKARLTVAELVRASVDFVGRCILADDMEREWNGRVKLTQKGREKLAIINNRKG